jgi:hypothetical protein
MNLKPNHFFILCLIVLAIIGTLLFLRIDDVDTVKVSGDGVEASFRDKARLAEEVVPPVSVDETTLPLESDVVAKYNSTTKDSPTSLPDRHTAPLVSQSFDTLELLIDSQMKLASLLVDGSEPEIYERTSIVISARFRHTADSRNIQLKNDKFTCSTSTSFSGKKRLSITMSNCKSN